jgi:tetratricopeptide (TPR) repeat protein
MPWKPQPIDTSGIPIPVKLAPLIERLAEHNHDVWARARIAEGWTPGPHRDDERRRHPDLVPYGDLAEGERRYDRETVIETIRLIVASGYRIESEPSNRPAQKPGLRAPAGGRHAALVAEWRRLLAEGGTPLRHAEMAQALLAEGEALLAIDLLTTALQLWTSDRSLLALQGLAFARSGATARAQAVLGALCKQYPTDADTAGMLARTSKDLAELERAPAVRRRHLNEAQRRYAAAWRIAVQHRRRDDAIYTGINAATLAFVLRRRAEARRIARAVARSAAAAPDTYWTRASLAEATLVLGDVDAALQAYAHASALAGDHWADMASTRRNARRLLAALGKNPHRADRCFPLPTVIVFSGHMLDRPGRPVQRFPTTLEHAVSRELDLRLAEVPVKIGYSGAASGADILFLEAMLRQNAPVHVVLPCPPDAFVQASVPQATWRRRFHRVLDRATSVTIADDGPCAPDTLAYASRLMNGLALLRAQRLDLHVVPMALWSSGSPLRPGGTTEFVRYWRSRGLPPIVIDPTTLAAVRRSRASSRQPTGNRRRPQERRDSLAMLFCDVVGFSDLRDEQFRPFVDEFMGGIARIIRRQRPAPIMSATWGDAIFVVYQCARDAGRLAIALSEWIRERRWDRVGLPAELTLRIGAHAGPVTTVRDPVTGRRNIYGTHVNWAARIEPIALHGEAYASEPFAALAASEGVREFRCEYVGTVPLAKAFASLPTYHLRPAGRTR